MGDYISRDMAIARLTKVEVTNRLATMTDAKRVIAEMPAADVAPVVHGRETREGGSTMISEAIDRAVKAKWRADLVNMLTDAGRTLAGTGLRANGSVYRDINIGLLLLEAARSLQECQSELEPENPDDVVVKVEVPDRWPMTEAGQRWAAQEAAATKPMTNGDRIQDRKDGELAERERLERLYEETRQITDRRAWAPESRCQTAAMRAAAEDIRGRLLAVSKAMRRWEAELYVGGIAVGVALEEAADLLGGVPPEEYRDEK